MAIQTTNTKSNEKAPATPATPAASGAAVQLKQALRGGSFEEQSAMLSPVQKKGNGPSTQDVHTAAAEGTKGGGGALPHLGAIQKAFGGHDVSGIQAHTGGAAAKASDAMGAQAFASGDHVAFKGAPDLHTAAHEAAHHVQQKGGVSLSGGVGQSGDRYEQHADQVADAVVQGKSAEPILDKMSGGSKGAVQKKAVQRREGDPTGITGGKVTLKDFNGGKDVSNVDKTKANLEESKNNSATLADMAKTVATGTARTEAEMMAAIAANTMPRYVARVGPKDNFTKYKSFGRNNEFIFATEPADLASLHPAAAMFKVGWTKPDIQGQAEKPIAVCILDTQKAVPSSADSSKTATVGKGKMEWPELKSKALGDTKFMDECKKQSIADAATCFDVWAVTPVKGDPKTTNPVVKADCQKIRVIMTNLYGANPLYSGMGATVTEGGNLCAREVMLLNNGTGFKLTNDNHVLVDTTPTKYTKSEADAL